ncbi:TIGR02328 family protein, partial [Schleiferilactobacillus harbinensis]|uniref:TIGR02328 family protein n=1 Tax=Schleiferilactobacillus harbinensis TaxID=304207 RepID=UPI001F198F1D
MRLWHQALISKLPRQQLLGQHREIAALRGNGWGRRHATVDYVFRHSPFKLFQFHRLVLNEMVRRGYRPNKCWYNP